MNTLQVRTSPDSPWTALPVLIREGATSYNDLKDKPSLNAKTIEGNKVLGDYVEFISTTDILDIWNSI